MFVQATKKDILDIFPNFVVQAVINNLLLNYLQALNKKDHKGGPGGSPDDDLCGDSDTEQETPGTEAKYNKIDEEFQLIMQNRNNNGHRVSFN